ncbi:MAG TPA: hypothetical protein CFH81_08765 [Sulfurovum sp. UBA12169]|nr:MAG TPA: hypothetical protein CFH81_08765 [Sulfurovum sp. UBA12169]
MAIGDDMEIRVRMYYETHDLSTAKVEEYFTSIGHAQIKRKTMESWMQRDKKAGIPWIKNRYATLDEAFESLVDIGVLGSVEDKAKGILKESLTKEHGAVLNADVIEDMAQEGARQMVYRTLNKYSLGEKMAKNLERAETIVLRATTMGNVATFHRMLIDTHQAVHGKTTNIGLQNPNSQSLSEEEIKTKSTEELRSMLEEGLR